MTNRKTIMPSNDDTVKRDVVDTPGGRVTFDDFSIDDMMSSFDDDESVEHGGSQQSS